MPAESCGIDVDSLPWPVQWFQVRAGKVCTLTAEWVFTDTRTYELWAQVDTDDHIPESNEYNNIFGPFMVQVDTNHHIVHTEHVDFMKGEANTLVVWTLKGDDVNPNIPPYVKGDGKDATLTLGLFREPPYYSQPPFANGVVSPTLVDYNAHNPDYQLNVRGTGIYTDYDAVNASVATPGAAHYNFVVVVWEDGRNGPVYNRDIYLRWSADSGATWSPEIKVSDDRLEPCGGTGTAQANQLSPVVAVSEDGVVIVAWADDRCGDFDIFVQQYQLDFATPALTPVGQNVRVTSDEPGAGTDQKHPDLTVDEDGTFYLVWEDHRFGNPDIFFTRSITDSGVILWKPETKISDPTGPTAQEMPAVGVLKTDVISEIRVIQCYPGDPPVAEVAVITKNLWVVAVAWEDDRNNPESNIHDIYMAFSPDKGDTFSKDMRLNDDEGMAEQRGVDVDITQGMKLVQLELNTPCGLATVEILAPVADIHVVWQDFRNGPDDPDIYYVPVHYEPDPQNPSSYVLTIGGNEKINHHDELDWTEEKKWQGEPSITASKSCPEEEYRYDVYIAWADSRNYDDLNTDIFVAMKSTCPSPPWSEWNSGTEWLNWMVNSGARMRQANAPVYASYPDDNPPHTRQHRPSLASATLNPWPGGPYGRLYLVWDDNRNDGKTGVIYENRDVFFTTSPVGFAENFAGYTASGSYLSPIIDAGEPVTWYIVSWEGVVPEFAYMTVQTRVGDDLSDFEGDGNWVPWDYPCASLPVCSDSAPCGPVNPPEACERVCPYPPSPDDCTGNESGAPLQGFEAPGQHIRLAGIAPDGTRLYEVRAQRHIAAANGSLFPRARYIQYRVNFWSRRWFSTPFLKEITLHYQKPFRVYLPLVLKNH